MTHTLAGRSRYIPWLFVAGFAVVIAVNATMMWFAVGSFSGLYTRDALGWRVEAAWHTESSRLEVSVLDSAGQPLTGARVRAELIRPVEKRPPLAVVLAAFDLGRFAASVDLPERGNWDLDIVVDQGGDRYALTRRMFLK